MAEQPTRQIRMLYQSCHRCTSQEEADTILPLRAIGEASQNVNAANIISTDTDVLSLSLAYIPRLGANPCMLVGHEKSRELIVLKPQSTIP